MKVTLRLNGGWNGDIYVYLTHSGGFSVLLNRAGRTSGDTFGYSDAGLNVTFDDAAANGDIHLYQSVGGFTTSITDGSGWAPDGRNGSPLGILDTNPRTAFLSSFNGLDPNGDWTLFVADLGNGEVSTVANWGLAIEAASTHSVSVPDTGSSLLLLAASALCLATFKRRIAPV